MTLEAPPYVEIVRETFTGRHHIEDLFRSNSISELTILPGTISAKPEMPHMQDATPGEIGFCQLGATLAGPTEDIGFFFAQDVATRGTGYIFQQSRLLARPGALLPYVAGMIRDGQRVDIATAPNLPVHEIDEPVLVIVAEAALIYGHWLLDYLPRLWLFDRYFPFQHFRPKLLLPSITPEWALDIIQKFFRRSRENIIFYDYYGAETHLKRAVIPSFLHVGHNFHEIMNNFAYDMIRAAAEGGGTVAEAAPYIYVSRHKQRHSTSSMRRRLKDEEEILSLAEKHGYVVVCPETLTWLEQVRIFSQARVVVGEAGSALHNSLFAPLGSVVAAIPPDNHVQISLASLRHHKLASLSPTNKIEIDGEAEYAVDRERFARLLAWAAQAAG